MPVTVIRPDLLVFLPYKQKFSQVKTKVSPGENFSFVQWKLLFPPGETFSLSLPLSSFNSRKGTKVVDSEEKW